MASSGSEHVDYDDDFEEVSDEEGGTHKSLHGALRRDSSRKKTGEVPASPLSDNPSGPPPGYTTPVAAVSAEAFPQPLRPKVDTSLAAGLSADASLQAGVLLGGRPDSKEGRRPGRRRGEDEPRTPPVMRSSTEDALEMNTSGGSFTNTAGRRPVRAKISVGESEPADRRPGTSDSGHKAAASRPIWLQSDEGAHRPLPRHASPNQGGLSSQIPARSLSGDRSLNPPASPGRVPGRGRPPTDPDFDGDGRLGTSDGSDRKVVRLKQEVQRLTARLKELELFSAQDEGLAVFTLEEVEIGCMIGQGGFCHVHHGHWRSTPCALKKIFDPVITDELRGEFENEVRMLIRLRHPNVITIMGVCRVPPALSILTEFVAGGSLFELLHGPPKAKRKDSIDCDPTNLLPVVRQCSAALAYLHAMLVVHRDVKSHNVLLTPGQFPVAKLCDFGLARPKSELCTGTMQWAGTPCYMAPELFAKRKYTESVDVFALGVMLWEAMSTEIPHYNMEPADIAHRVQSKDGAGLPVQHSWPKALKTLLRTSLAVQMEDRPSMVSMSEQLQTIIVEFPTD